MRAKAIILALLGGIALTTAIVAASREREPTYHGKTLSQWLAGGEDVAFGLLANPNRPDTREAVLQIGTNALPSLLEWIRYNPPAWRQKLDSRLGGVWPWYAHWVMQAEGRRDLAVDGFWVLGSRAAPAVPALARLLRNPDHKTLHEPALNALRLIGKDSLPILFPVLVDPNQGERYKIADAIAGISVAEGFSRAHELEQRLDDPDPAMRVAVANAILWVNGVSWKPF